MNLEKQKPEAPRLHSVVRERMDGTALEYPTKLFRVLKKDGRATTISVEPLEFIDALSRFKTNQKGISPFVRAAYSRLDTSKGWKKGVGKSAQTWALAVKMLEAQHKGVSLDEYLHAEANNAAWQ